MTSEISVTSHAIEEATKKFGIPHKRAKGWICAQYKKSRFVGEVLSEEGKPGRLFAYRRTAIILAPDSDNVITVYPRHHATKTLEEPIQELIERKVRVAKRKVRAMEKRLRLARADINVEIAELERRIVRTKSDAVRLACRARIAALDEALAQMSAELYEEQQELSTLLKGVVKYL